MKFSHFVSYLTRLEQTSSRIDITTILAELFTELSETEIKEACYLLSGTVAPKFESVVFNVADKMMERALSLSFDVPPAEVAALHKKLGDLGEVGESVAAHTSKDSSTVHEVFVKLTALTKEEGDGSQEKRVELMSELLRSLSPSGVKYAVRIILGRLRLGFSEKTLIDALSWMETGGKDKSKVIGRAYEVIPDIGTLAEKVKKEGADRAAKHAAPIIGIPVMPMLCQRLKSPADMIAKMGMVAVEPKFDGLRVLIHVSGKKHIFKAFTRNLKDVSLMFPELKDILKHIDAEEFILDSEAVGMDAELMKIADFQTTMQRRRKHDIEETLNKIPVTFQVFDILYIDGKSLMDTPYSERRAILGQRIKNGSLLKVDDSTITDDPAVITKLHHELRSQGLEGIIVKKLDSEYIPGRVGWRWVKMKEAEASTGKLPDTVDGIIMGYTQGQGKRAKFGIGQFLVGIVEGDMIKTITKVGTGLSDDQFKELSKRLHALRSEDMPHEYAVHKDLTPDFWVKPDVVVELAGDDLTVSPKHTAGYALRFPRLVKFRDDKSPKQATTISEIKKLYKLQFNQS